MKLFRYLLLFCLSTLIFRPVSAHGDTTWAEHIAPILYQSCTPCHHPGGGAPFSLMTYQDAYNWSQAIYVQTSNKKMPPWPADPSFRRLAHERILSDVQISAIKDWVADGAKMGDITKAPKPPVYNDSFKVSATNRNIRMESYQVKITGGADLYRCFPMRVNNTQQEYVTAWEVVPGNSSIVHHVLVFADTSEKPFQLDAADPDPGYNSFGGTGSNSSVLIGVWVPGAEPTYFPNGMGFRLLPNANLIFQVHYPASANGQRDSTQIRLRTTTNAMRNLSVAAPLNFGSNLINGPLMIPANTVKSFRSEFNLTADISVLSVGPHMHLIGKKMVVYGILPNKDTLKLIRINDWDFHWQGFYNFKNVLKIPKGTKLVAEAEYDNTTNNPRNPNNPPKDVRAGEATDDEMLLCYFTYTLYQNGDENIKIDSGFTVANETPFDLVGDLKIYPNPAREEVWMDAQYGPGRLLIYDIQGALRLVKDIHGQGDIISLQGCAPGVYMVKFESNQKVYFSRLVVQ